jgi:hypothetical protein
LWFFFVVVVVKNQMVGWTPVAHAYNPSYSVGRDHEDCGSKPAQGTPHTHTQKKVGEAGRLAQGVRPEFKPQYRKNRWQ